MAIMFNIAELCIYILTWNVGGHNPKNISLSDVLSLNGTSTCPGNKIPDIYVVGFQEVNNKPIEQLESFIQANKWTLKITELIKYNYEIVKTEQMQGISISIWTKPRHLPYMLYIETKETGTGLMDFWGNKGAVSVRMSLYGTGVTFVVAHLAAHDGKLDERIEDYNQIVKQHRYKSRLYRKIFDHAVVFWAGDLNFRLNGLDSASNIRGEIKRNNLANLFARDQLTMVRKTGRAFALMDEQQPSFPPTFKFVEGTSDYDLKRRPAWCDRILYRVVKDKYPDVELELQQLSYKSHPQYTISDHKPVTAAFLYRIKANFTHTSEEKPKPQINSRQESVPTKKRKIDP